MRRPWSAYRDWLILIKCDPVIWQQAVDPWLGVDNEHAQQLAQIPLETLAKTCKERCQRSRKWSKISVIAYRKRIMKLILENIGLLKHAEITLHKLCVIAGENDNGKSTIGKIVFCIVKAISKYKEDLQESKEFLVSEKIDAIYFLLREGFHAAAPEFFDALKSIRFSSGKYKTATSDPLKIIDTIIVKFFDLDYFQFESKKKVRELRAEIQRILDEPEDINQSIKNAFTKVFASEFDSSLLLQGAVEGSIQLIENNIQLIHLRVSQKGVTLLGEVEPIFLSDATFIESPLILNNHDILLRSQTLLDMDQRSRRLGVPYTTLHTKDLFNKLRTPALPFDLFTESKSQILVDEIQRIIDGAVIYDKGERDFVFRRGAESVSIKNTASGIKVFGLLQILIANDFVSNNTILIFDEPENHLHPKWQLKLAQALLMLVEKGVYVLVSSHSPYMIEALKRGVDRAGLTGHACFYLAENKSITDKDRLSEVFEVLVEPFEEFRQMDAENLKDE